MDNKYYIRAKSLEKAKLIARREKNVLIDSGQIDRKFSDGTKLYKFNYKRIK